MDVVEYFKKLKGRDLSTPDTEKRVPEETSAIFRRLRWTLRSRVSLVYQEWTKRTLGPDTWTSSVTLLRVRVPLL